MKVENALNYKVDRTDWDAGPWDGEPDRVDFHHQGLACLMLRNSRSGNWCGYVGVPREHPYYGQSSSEPDVDVHGGLTYAAACDGSHGAEKGQTKSKRKKMCRVDPSEGFPQLLNTRRSRRGNSN